MLGSNQSWRSSSVRGSLRAIRSLCRAPNHLELQHPLPALQVNRLTLCINRFPHGFRCCVTIFCLLFAAGLLRSLEAQHIPQLQPVFFGLQKSASASIFESAAIQASRWYLPQSLMSYSICDQARARAGAWLLHCTGRHWIEGLWGIKIPIS